MWNNVFHFLWWVFEFIADFFVWQPSHFWAVSAVFGVLFLAALMAKTRFPQIRCWPLFIACLMWLVFGFLELDNVIHKPNIRVDILLIWPFIFTGTALLMGPFILGLIHAAIAWKARK